MATITSVAVTFERILVPTDFSDVSQRALQYAKTLAKQGNSELLLVHVDPPINLITPEAACIDESEIQALHEERLEESVAALVCEGYRTRTISLTGQLYGELRSAIKQYKVDLIVLGTHGRKGLDRLLLGSDAEAVLRQARCPVLSVGPAVPGLQDKMWNIREVICPTTFDPRSAEVAAYAHKLASQYEAELILFHVERPGSQEDAAWVSFEEGFRRHDSENRGKYSWLRASLTNTGPGSSIVDLVKQRGSDLIVMGAHPASSMATHLAPGTAAQVLMEAPCPVMTLLQP